MIDLDFFLAYGFSMSGMNSNQQAENIFIHLGKIKRTFPLLNEAIFSDRHPYTIMKIAGEMGMYIPPKSRLGLAAYRFFIHNLKYYEEVLEQPDPTIYEIIMATDSVQFLMKFKDHQILKAGYKFTRNYKDRREMIEQFIQENILQYGKFQLTTHSRKVYDTKAKTIEYKDHKEKLHFSVNDFLDKVDLKNRRVMKTQTEAFTNLSLIHLRQQLLKQIEQWYQRDGYMQNYISKSLQNLLNALERILQNEVKSDISAYLGQPIII